MRFEDFKFKKLDLPANWLLQQAARGSILVEALTNNDRLSVIITKDGGVLHISISHPNRYPTWKEMTTIKYHFYPDIEMAMYFPKRSEYVNYHPNCFHLWEVQAVKTE